MRSNQIFICRDFPTREGHSALIQWPEVQIMIDIVLCFDGTWNSNTDPKDPPTNVWRLHHLVHRSCCREITLGPQSNETIDHSVASRVDSPPPGQPPYEPNNLLALGSIWESDFPGLPRSGIA
jgi:hypothetical protein